jgi:hypothetical protein
MNVVASRYTITVLARMDARLSPGPSASSDGYVMDDEMVM